MSQADFERDVLCMATPALQLTGHAPIQPPLPFILLSLPASFFPCNPKPVTT